MKKFSLGSTPVLLLTLAAGMVLLLFSEAAKQGVRQGLSLCAETLIPSLFVFLCLSSLATAYSGAKIPLLTAVLSRLFRLPARAASVCLLAFLGGYPVGPMMSAQLYEGGHLSDEQAARMPLFCCCSGPAFCVLAVGEGLCGSKQAGYVILASNVLAQCLIGIALGFLKRKNSGCEKPISSSPPPEFSLAFTKAVDSGTAAMLSVCAYVILFQVILGLLARLPLPAIWQRYAAAALEVTGGCQSFRGNIPVLCAILGFGGVSVLFQIKKYLHITGTKMLHYLAARAVAALLSFGICKLLLLAFPVALPTLAGGMQAKAVSYSAPLSAALVLLLAVYILDSKTDWFHRAAKGIAP